MSAATVEPAAAIDLPEHDAADYRALHSGAIIGALVAICSLVYPLTVSSMTDVQYLLLMAAIPVIGIAISAVALRAIRANREVYTGQAAALAGLAIAVCALVAGSAYGAYVFATEVPEGYARISFQAMKPSDDDRQAGRAVPVPIQQAIEQQTNVFIKGYIRPSSIQYGTGIKEFLLVRDNNECCFGDLTKVMFFDQIAVTMTNGLTVDYDGGLFRLGGKLSVRPGDPRRQEPGLVYSLQADYVN